MRTDKKGDCKCRSSGFRIVVDALLSVVSHIDHSFDLPKKPVQLVLLSLDIRRGISVRYMADMGGRMVFNPINLAYYGETPRDIGDSRM